MVFPELESLSGGGGLTGGSATATGGEINLGGVSFGPLPGASNTNLIVLGLVLVAVVFLVRK